MTIQIVISIRNYLLLLFLVLAGFIQWFWFLCSNDSNSVFGNETDAFQHGFLYMLGQGVNDNFGQAILPNVAKAVLDFFLIVMIVMFNLLIAYMGDIFALYRAIGQGLWRKEQAAMMIEESYLYRNSPADDDEEEEGEESRPGQEHLVHPYLHVLRYASDVNNNVTEIKRE
jgi:hypothetical protein